MVSHTKRRGTKDLKLHRWLKSFEQVSNQESNKERTDIVHVLVSKAVKDYVSRIDSVIVWPANSSHSETWHSRTGHVIDQIYMVTASTIWNTRVAGVLQLNAMDSEAPPRVMSVWLTKQTWEICHSSSCWAGSGLFGSVRLVPTRVAMNPMDHTSNRSCVWPFYYITLRLLCILDRTDYSAFPKSCVYTTMITRWRGFRASVWVC